MTSIIEPPSPEQLRELVRKHGLSRIAPLTASSPYSQTLIF